MGCGVNINANRFALTEGYNALACILNVLQNFLIYGIDSRVQVTYCRAKPIQTCELIINFNCFPFLRLTLQWIEMKIIILCKLYSIILFKYTRVLKKYVKFRRVMLISFNKMMKFRMKSRGWKTLKKCQYSVNNETMHSTTGMYK